MLLAALFNCTTFFNEYISNNSTRFYERSARGQPSSGSPEETMIKDHRGLGSTKDGKGSSLSQPLHRFNPALPFHMYSTYSQKAADASRE